MSHRAVRLFRRDRARWQFRLHEQVVSLPGMPALDVGDLEGMRLVHSGYLTEAVYERDKTARNIRIAKADLEEEEHSDAERATKVVSLGRSLVLAGRFEEALARFTEAVENPDCQVVQRRTALRNGTEVMMAVAVVDATSISEAYCWEQGHHEL